LGRWTAVWTTHEDFMAGNGRDGDLAFAMFAPQNQARIWELYE
jgi:hypothetical protein